MSSSSDYKKYNVAYIDNLLKYLPAPDIDPSTSQKKGRLVNWSNSLLAKSSLYYNYYQKDSEWYDQAAARTFLAAWMRRSKTLPL